MASTDGTIEARGENLNDSWVELHFKQQTSSENVALMKPLSVYNMPSSMEKLLLEAQKENSRGSSRAPSSRGSPKSPHSPTNESVTMSVGDISTIQEVKAIRSGEESHIPTDWIWDWSSRPEALPPSECTGRFRHPRRHKLSIRNTRVMRSGPFSFENLPVLLLSHACTFFLGAAAMFIFVKKCCKWSANILPAGTD